MLPRGENKIYWKYNIIEILSLKKYNGNSLMSMLFIEKLLCTKKKSWKNKSCQLKLQHHGDMINLNKLYQLQLQQL